MATKSVSFGQPSDFVADQERVLRQRRMAEMLQQESMQETPAGQMVSGYYVPTSPLTHLAKALKGYNARAENKRLDEETKALAERRRADMGQDMQTMIRALKGVPATSEAIVDEQANGGMGAPATINAPAVNPTDAMQAALMNMRTPEMQQAGFGLVQQQIAQQMRPPERVDLGDKIRLVKDGVIVGTLPKGATPDTVLKERGSMERHATPSGSTIYSGGITMRGQDETARHNRVSEGISGGNLNVARENLGLSRERLDMDREKSAREKFGEPKEFMGPDGRPVLLMQDKNTGQMVDATTRQPVAGFGPKLGESASKQLGGVESVKSAISDYRKELEGWKKSGALSPDARARMGTYYNNMLLQAKEAYNLGVLNGPDYEILQSVITDPRGLMGTVTSKKTLDEQARVLDSLMTKVGRSVVGAQSGIGADKDPLGIRK